MSTTAELLEIRALAREFAAAELRPHTEQWDTARALDDDVPAKIAELGFFGMLLPEESGGMGFDLPTFVAALEELAWGEPAAALLVAHNVIAADLLARFGGAAHAELVTQIASGERRAALAFADEDGDGVRAAKSGDGWKLDGRRSWVANAATADAIIVAARDDGGSALFVIPRERFETGEPLQTMGLRAAPVHTVTVRGEVAADARLDWRGADAHEALSPLGALSAAALAVAIAQAALDHAVAYAAQREQFGQALRTFEGIQVKLAEMATRTAGARALVERAAADPQDAAVAMAKLAAGGCAMYVTTEAVQVFGGYGYMRDYPVEKLMRDAKAMEILHGTSEIQRLRIAASLYAE